MLDIFLSAYFTQWTMQKRESCSRGGNYLETMCTDRVWQQRHVTLKWNNLEKV